MNVHGSISKRENKYAKWILFNISQMIIKLGHQCPEHSIHNYSLTKKQKANIIMKS